MLPCVIVLTPLTHIYINRVCFDVRTSRGLTGVPSSGWLTHISRKFLTIALNLGRKLIKVGWWHDYLYQEATLCSESAPAYHWSRGTLVWGDEEMEIIFFWLGKPCSRCFQWTGGISWPMRVDCQPPTWWLGLCVGGHGGEDTAASQPCLCGCVYRHAFAFICIKPWFSSMPAKANY